MGKLLCSKKETADALGVSLRTVDNLIGRKELGFRRVGRRVLIPAKELERFTRYDHQTRQVAKANAPDGVDKSKQDSAAVLGAETRSKA
jgi:excisionase family DNA binding protein